MDVDQTNCGDHFTIHTNIKSLGGTPETNTMLHVIYILTEKEKKKIIF